MKGEKGREQSRTERRIQERKQEGKPGKMGERNETRMNKRT